MPFIPAVNTARVQVWQELLGQMISNTFYVRADVPFVESSLDTLCDTVIAEWNAQMGPILCDKNQFRTVKARDMTTEEGFGMEKAFPALSGGDRTGPALPGNVALACKLITNYSGRNRRGRIYLGGFEEAQVIGNQIEPIVVYDQILSNVRAFVQNLNAGAGEVVVASFFDGMALEENARGETVWTPVPRETALLTPVTNVVVDPFTDTMKSRLQGRGN